MPQSGFTVDLVVQEPLAPDVFVVKIINKPSIKTTVKALRTLGAIASPLKPGATGQTLDD
jgi:hypothetical protein